MALIKLNNNSISAVTELPSGISGQNYPAFTAYMSSDVSLSNNTFTKLQFDTEEFDTDNCYDATTNYRFTPTVAGKYMFFASVQISTDRDFNNYILRFLKNGSAFREVQAAHHHYEMKQLVTTAEANGSTDYFEVQVKQDSGITVNARGNQDETYFGAYKIIE